MKKPKRKSATRPRKSTRRATSTKDAIALLKADHREVEGWFSQFEKSRDDERKEELAGKICTALKVHTTIEEEIFYPAFLEAAKDSKIHHEAVIEHDGAKRLIADIESSDSDDEYYDARVLVLKEMIKHHVKEEEQPGGMFTKARKSGMDLVSLGNELSRAKKDLMNGGEKSFRPGLERANTLFAG